MRVSTQEFEAFRRELNTLRSRIPDVRVATLIGISRQTVARWRDGGGRRQMTRERLTSICEALEIDLGAVIAQRKIPATDASARVGKAEARLKSGRRAGLDHDGRSALFAELALAISESIVDIPHRLVIDRNFPHATVDIMFDREGYLPTPWRLRLTDEPLGVFYEVCAPDIGHGEVMQSGEFHPNMLKSLRRYVTHTARSHRALQEENLVSRLRSSLASVKA